MRLLLDMRNRDPKRPESHEMQEVFRIRARISCPRCGAEIGEDCRTPKGTLWKKMHEERILSSFPASVTP